ncbi:unnamed protein product [Effrenium voratum]|nr:unnamed protein product [Effrenium voratum]
MRSMGRQSMWLKAVDLFEEMQEKQVAADTLALNAALSACEEAAAWAWALRLLSTPPAVPDLACFRKALSSCRKAACWISACQLLADLAGLGFLADATTLQEAIAACEGAGDVASEAARQLRNKRQLQERAFSASWPMRKKLPRSAARSQERERKGLGAGSKTP